MNHILQKIKMISRKIDERIEFFKAIGDYTSEMKIIELEWFKRLLNDIWRDHVETQPDPVRKKDGRSNCS